MSTLAYSLEPRSATARARDRLAIRGWLYAVAVVLFALVLVGGATRLTESGLSITEWKPIHGVIPPLSAGEWQEEFDLYRQIPQYQQINRGMSLDEFKTIYWWEWAHRLLARGVGFVFALPLAFFWLTGRLEPFLKPRLVGILALGGVQGAIGWWMVASGLVERTDVSQYRLATHLTIACIIFAATLWVASGLAPRKTQERPARSTIRSGQLIMVLALVQIYLGGLVAGLNAGLTFNTWPLMDGTLVPGGLLVMEPAWRNFFENVMTVQFVHRTGAYVLFAAVLLHAVLLWRKGVSERFRQGALLLCAAVTVQAAIGITTLLLAVPIGWALMHQAGGLVVLALAVFHARALKGEYPIISQAARD
ncbi:COX15/CtaA family protein [Jiella marina]|uniref:COX15/CtaA family protein n=1 Tax=Jiella sp. LLJ827 TaxID=2917712 RepID=UPI00210195D3|nr:COX15/CtaA family protein [Jiella sp. LLJ827]MCQ0986288.1 COX15/CtaA family protein [Jiella sp. LLJ827]